jgi:L-fuculose-phosphate aldolase
MSQASREPRIDEATARTLLAATGRRMIESGLVTGTAGNLSLRTGPDTIAITPSSVAYDTIEPVDICLMSVGDDSQLDGSRVPSSEWPMHRAIYRSSDAEAIVHTHSFNATAVSSIVDELPAIHYYILRLGGESVRVAPFRPFGSQELADTVSEALADRNTALLQNHGAISYGPTLDEAFERAALLEWLAMVYLRARSAGVEPRALSVEELDGVRAQQVVRRALMEQS